MADERKGPMASPGYHLWNASLRWTQEVARALSPLGLTHTQFFLLGAVSWLTKSRGEAPKQREVAEFARLDKVMTSQVTRALEGDGLLTRADDPDDSRAWLITVTPKGRKMFLEAVTLVREVDHRFFGSRADHLRDELSKLHGG
ncbi:MAG: MarR family transcriptional regulator [Archangiaceae bacterium]|nr:MarR family transcriptional regulator [Archangiaceae bacterium]